MNKFNCDDAVGLYLFVYRCVYCQLYLSPNKFIFHFHRVAGSRYHHPDAANFNSWRRHLSLDYVDPPEELVHAWEDVKAMFNGGSRKRLASPVPSAGAKISRTGETGTSRETDRRPQDESVGRVKRQQRVLADARRVVPGSNRPATVCMPHPRAAFYLQPSSSNHPTVQTGPGTNGASSISQPHYPRHLPPPPPLSVHSGSTACVPYHDIVRMQMLDVWKARAAAAAAAAAVVCPPITPHISMVWPPPTTLPGTAVDFLTAVARPSRNPLEQFLTLPGCSQRALAASGFNAHQARSSPLPGDMRKPFSAFRLVSDVDERHPVLAGTDNDHDDMEEEDSRRTQMDGNANLHCSDDDDDVAPHCDDELNNNEAHDVDESSEFISQQRSTNEVFRIIIVIERFNKT